MALQGQGDYMNCHGKNLSTTMARFEFLLTSDFK